MKLVKYLPNKCLCDNTGMFSASGIPMIAFPRVQCMFSYNYVCHTHALYIRKLCLGQLTVVHSRTYARALKKESLFRKWK